MLTIEEILATQKHRRAKPTQEEDLRRLPYRKAFVYGRVSDPNQVRDSKESIREIAKLVDLARNDGYRSNTTAQYVERLLESVQQGKTVDEITEDILLRNNTMPMAKRATVQPTSQ